MQKRLPLPLASRLAMLAAAATVVACSDPGGGPPSPDGTVDATDASVDASVDAGPPGPCEVLGLSARAFEQAADVAELRATAADVTVPTTEGDFSLAGQWTGCDVHLFVPDEPTQIGAGFPRGLWETATDVQRLFTRLPRNVHLFFVSFQSGQPERTAALDALRAIIEDVFALMEPEERDWWEPRVHFVPDRASTLPGWLGQLLANPGFGLGLDRAQRIRFLGGFGDPNRYSATVGWFAPNISMLANEALHYNVEAERQTRLDAQAATVVTLFDGEPVAANGGGRFPVVVDLPDTATLAGMDTLELDMTMTCVGPGEYGDCPAWDYDVFLELCDTVDATQCDQEIGHWITSYHREGRWVHDVSGLLPLLADGGPKKLELSISDPWEVGLHLRFSNSGKSVAPAETVPLWVRTQGFDETYNDYFPPLTVHVPADAARVELVTAITGHGMSQPGNCAEFCNTDHHFFVNGTDNLRDFPVVGNPLGCQDQIAQGTVPNQMGTWWYGRGGWCPGKQVDHTVTDITAQVVLGADNLFEYEGYYLGQPYSGDNWRHIHVASWLVVHR